MNEDSCSCYSFLFLDLLIDLTIVPSFREGVECKSQFLKGSGFRTFRTVPFELPPGPPGYFHLDFHVRDFTQPRKVTIAHPHVSVPSRNCMTSFASENGPVSL